MGKTELEKLLSAYNWWMGISTIAVAVGILGEYVAHFIFEKEPRRRTETAFTIVFGVLVLGGVAGEYIFGSRLSETANALQQLSDQEVAGLNTGRSSRRRPCGTYIFLRGSAS